MSINCPCCGKEMRCLGGCSGHPINWYCSDEDGCGYQAWNGLTHKRPAKEYAEVNADTNAFAHDTQEPQS